MVISTKVGAEASPGVGMEILVAWRQVQMMVQV